MDESTKLQIMSDTVKPIINLLDERLRTRTEMLTTLGSQPLDTSIPESVKKMREEEASKMRAVVQELNDLKAIIKVLYPNV